MRRPQTRGPSQKQPEKTSPAALPGPAASDHAPSIHAFDSRISRHHRHIIAAMVVLSLVARAIYFIQLSGGPLVHQHEWNQCDMNYFDSWARQIAAGDWLSRDVAPPMHAWLVRVADAYYGATPTDIPGGPAASPENEARRVERAKALWQQWCGNGRLWQEPLYPYLVAVTYKVFGPDVRWVSVWQMLMGTAGNVLVYLIAKKCFGGLAGALAGLFAVLYAPLLMYEMVLLRETTIIFASLALVYLAITALERSSGWRWALTGLAFGVALTLKAQFWLMLPGLVVIAAISLRHQTRAAMGRMGAMVLGAVLGFSPLVVRNVIVGVSPMMTSSATGAVFALADAADSGTYTWGEHHLADIMRQSQGRLWPAIVATLHTHPDVRSVLSMVGRRFLAIWQWYDCPNNENFYYYRLYAGILRWLPLTYGALAPLAVAGLLISLRRPDARRSMLYVVLLANIPLILFSFVWCRYRLPIVAALLPLAGLAVARLIEWLLARRWAPGLAMAGALALLAIWINRPTEASVVLIRCADCTVPHKVYYNPRIEAAYAKNDWRAISEILIESLRYEPDEVRALGPARKVRLSEEACLAELYIRKRQLLVQALDAVGRSAEARQQSRRVEELQAALRSGR
jgi:4-amino-4-deoxy-L-arabinose transferase-like glycosyltransferase